MRFLLLLTFIHAILLSSTTDVIAGDDITIRILFTHNSNGKLVNCNCRSDPYGGLAERADFIRSYRERHAEILLLDSGGYFGLSDFERKGKLVLTLMEAMGYDVWGIGDQELYHGLGSFKKIAGEYRAKVINASLYTQKDSLVFTPYKIFTIKGVRIGVLGLASAETFRFLPSENRDFIVVDPDSVLTRIVPALKDSCDYIIILSQMGIDPDKKIAKKWPDIDLIIGGHSQTLLKDAVTISGCRIVQAGSYARRVGEIVVRFDQFKKKKNFSYKLHEITGKYTIPPDIQVLLERGKNIRTNSTSKE